MTAQGTRCGIFSYAKEHQICLYDCQIMCAAIVYSK